MIPTGLPTEYKNKQLTLEQRLANLLNIYGIPNSYKWTLTYIDYYKTKSLFSLINLIKLQTNYASAYCCSALAVTLGRIATTEIKDLRLLYPQVSAESLNVEHAANFGRLASLSELQPYFNLSSFEMLNGICKWFEYEPFIYPGEYMQNPLLLIKWLEEPYRTYMLDLTPKVYIAKTLQRYASFTGSNELNKLIGAVFV